MLRTIITIATCSLIFSLGKAQTKVGSNVLNIDPASILELESDSSGFLPSRLTTAQRNAQTEWDEGHIIYNITDNCLQIFDGIAWDCFVQGISVDSTIYKYNDTLTSDRIVGMGGYQLTFDGSGDVVITDAGFVGIGDPTPDAKLDVEGGTVRFSDYGLGNNPGSESYLLGVDSDGDVVEVTPAIDTFSLVGDTLRISLKGDGVAYDSILLSKYLDDINIYKDDGTILGNRTVDLDGFYLRTRGTDSGANIQFQNDGDIRQFGPGALHQLIDTSGTDLRLFAGPTTTYLSSFTDVPLFLRQNNANVIGLLTNEYLRFYNYGSGLRTGTPSNILGVEADGDVVEIDPMTLGSDDQILDSLGLTGTLLEIGIEGDANGLQTLDLSSLTHTGTAGSIFFADGSDGSPTEDNTNLFWDDTNNRLGIGTAAPSVDMHLSGATGSVELLLEADTNNAGESNQPKITFSQDGGGITGHIGFTGGTNNLRISNESTSVNSDIDFQTAGSTRVTIDGEGNVGIGTTDPQARLEVDGGTVRFSNYGSGAEETGSETYILGVEADGDVVEIDPMGLGTNIYNTSSSLEAFRTVDMDGNDLNFVGSSKTTAITSTGSLGVGITNPARPLHVNEALRLSRGSNTTSFIFDRYNGNLGTTWKSFLMGVNASSAGSGEFIIADYNENVSGGGFTRMLTLTDATLPIRFDQYGTGAPSFRTGNEVAILGVESDGDIVEVDASAIGNNIYNTSDTIESNRLVTLDGSSLSFVGTDTIQIDAAGNLGIGTNSPAARLDVADGTVRFSEYGSGTQADTTNVDYILVTNSSGDVKELNTAKNTRWFYPPAVIIDASDMATGEVLDLHQEYIDQFGTPEVSSDGAASSIPTYGEDELEYHITFFDDTILDNITITSAGVMTYDIISVPFDNYTIINVVFVIKDP